MSRSATTTAPQEAASGAPAQDWEIEVHQSTTPFVPQGSVIRIKDKGGLKELTVDEDGTVKWGPHKFEFDPAAGRGKAHKKEKEKDKVVQLLELFVIPSPNVPGEISGISGAFLTFPPASPAAMEDPETLGVWGSETRTPPPREDPSGGGRKG